MKQVYLFAIACLSLSACLRHEPLVCGQQEPCPDGLVCSEGLCVQAPSCDGGDCSNAVTRCPAKIPADPSQVIAAVDLVCEYGEVECCGAKHPDTVCRAKAGESFACLVEEACLIELCDECAKDRDCGRGEVCEADRDARLVCVQGCRRDADCRPSQTCEQPVCVTVPCPAQCVPREDANMSTM